MNLFLFSFLNSLASKNYFLDKVIIFFAQYFIFFVILFVIIFLIFSKKGIKVWFDYFQRLKETFFVFLSSLFSWFFVQLVKEILKIPRPFEVLLNAKILFKHGSMDSFPSGHSAFLAALATSMFFIDRKFGIFLGFCALLVGISRVIAGIHFPLDVLGGFLIGILFSLIFEKIIFKK